MKPFMFIKLTGVLLFSLLVACLPAQVIISDNPSSVPDPSAILELDREDMGLLIPRISLENAVDVTDIPEPANSLLVYNINTSGSDDNDAVSPGFYCWDGDQGRWVRVYSGGGYAFVVAIGWKAAWNNSGIRVNALGLFAANENSGNDVNAFGRDAAFLNEGDDVNALGAYAARDNKVRAVNAFGGAAAMRNNGYIVNALGPQSCDSNWGNSVNGMGHLAAQRNEGSEVNAMGAMSAQFNTNGNVVAFGNKAAQYNTGYDVNALGPESARAAIILLLGMIPHLLMEMLPARSTSVEA